MTETEMDRVMETMLANLFTESKERRQIILQNFVPSINEHMCIYAMAQMAKGLFGFDVLIDMDWWHFFLFKIKYMKKFGYARRAKNLPGINCFKFASDINAAYNESWILDDIFNKYFKRNK